MKEKPRTAFLAAPIVLLRGLVQAPTVAMVVIGVLITFSAVAALRVPINLTVSVTPEHSVRFNRQALEALPSAQITTQTPFTQGEQRFEGVALSTVLDAAGMGECADLTLSAMNRYQAILSADMVARYQPVIAMKRNGQAMTLRTLGPLWLVFPLDQYPAIQTDRFYSAMVWQLTDITCQP
ncbi:hypothetical protein BZG82_09980 [Salinivibrio sp. PR5]|uniref:hypothetical protein n=1 Tax=Salinivibrio sp. PR5 TaxID=1909484 RepID=UPI00098AF563|nr:hypothetical protein [Salinivibrio sp. PR5]OOF09732.1 hypothetical protein BZG82_09980 [Salinivibrio sp. PR5]